MNGFYRIDEINEDYIRFEDGSMITFQHYQDCCEWNYADFEQLDDLARSAMFDTANLTFEAVEGSGFRFGNKDGRMYFVPCYSVQNGYYSSDIQIFYRRADTDYLLEVLTFDANWIDG